MITRNRFWFATLVVAIATTHAHADDTLASLAGERKRIDLAASKMKKAQKRLDAETVTLGATTLKLAAEAPAIVEERGRFDDFNSAVNAMVVAWNGNCAGEQEPARFAWCVEQRDKIQPDVTRRDTWDGDLTAKETNHDDTVAATAAAVAANTAELAELQRAKQALRAIEDDWRQRAAAWRVAEATRIGEARCRAIPDNEPERQKACWSVPFDGANPMLRECLDLPITQLRAFRRCLDRRVGAR